MGDKTKDEQGYYSENEEESNDNNNRLQGVVSFKDFLLRDELMRAIQECGFEKPSDVQNQAINYAVSGKDILCQAQAGTGKTAVFVLSILTSMAKDAPFATALVLAPTRELAQQIRDEFRRFSKYLPQYKTQAYFGGESIKNDISSLRDIQPQIIVGCPGRIAQLVQLNYLNLKNIKYFVVDECDKMMEVNRMKQDILDIFTKTPVQKQTMMFSGTISQEVQTQCTKFMLTGTPIIISVLDQSELVLNGLDQYQREVTENQKINLLKKILEAYDYNQAIIFLSSPDRVQALSKELEKSQLFNLFTHGQLPQIRRNEVYELFKENFRKILVTNDLFQRGMDFSKVNLVINFDMPKEKEGYLHRVGRAGRQRTKGIAISFVTTEDDKSLITKLAKDLKANIQPLPDKGEK